MQQRVMNEAATPRRATQSHQRRRLQTRLVFRGRRPWRHRTCDCTFGDSQSRVHANRPLAFALAIGAPSWPKTVIIEMIGNVPKRVPVGDRVEMKMKLTRGDSSSRKARIYYQINDGPVVQEFMTRGADGIYTASLDAKADAGKSAGLMKVWMTAGDDRKDINQIQVLPRLGNFESRSGRDPAEIRGRAAAGDGESRRWGGHARDRFRRGAPRDVQTNPSPETTPR